jgi:hypothetical protein
MMSAIFFKDEGLDRTNMIIVSKLKKSDFRQDDIMNSREFASSSLSLNVRHGV